MSQYARQLRMALAQSLMPQQGYQNIRTPLEGIGRLGQTFASVLMQKGVMDDMDAGRKRANDALIEMLSPVTQEQQVTLSASPKQQQMANEMLVNSAANPDLAAATPDIIQPQKRTIETQRRRTPQEILQAFTQNEDLRENYPDMFSGLMAQTLAPTKYEVTEIDGVAYAYNPADPKGTFEPLMDGANKGETGVFESVKDYQSFIEGVQDDYIKRAEPLIESGQALSTMREYVERGAPMDQISLLFNFYKALDPGSRVTEGEIQMSQGARSTFSALSFYIDKFNQNKVLTPEEMSGLYEAARTAFGQQSRSFQYALDDYRGRLSRVGADPNILRDPREMFNPAPYDRGDVDIGVQTTGPLTPDMVPTPTSIAEIPYDNQAALEILIERSENDPKLAALLERAAKQRAGGF